MKPRMLLPILLSLAMIIPAYSQAGGPVDDAASDALQAMELPLGARAAGLGQAFSPVADDPSALHWNPAGLTQLDKTSFTLSHNRWMMDGQYNDLAAAVPWGDWRVGAGLMVLNYGALEGRDGSGKLNGREYKPNAMGCVLAAATRVKKFGLGAGVKTYSEKVGDRSYTGVGLQAGLLYSTGQFRFSLGGRNIGAAGRYSIPACLFGGAAWRIPLKNISFLLATDMKSDQYLGAELHSGFEIEFAKLAGLRVGRSWVPGDVRTGDLQGLTGGAGIKYGNYGFDYALMDFGAFGFTHRVTLSVALSGKTPAPAASAATKR